MFFLIVCLTFLFETTIINAQRTVNYNSIEYKDTTMYVKGEDKPFTGIAKTYYENGKVDAEYSVENGIQNGMTKLYYKTGELDSEIPFVDGLEQGIAKTYYKNGNVDTEMYYEKGSPEGIAKWYYETGELEAEFPYVAGNRHGVANYYDKKGKIVNQEFYVDGFSTSESNYKKFLDNKITKDEILKEIYQQEPKKKFSFNFYSIFGMIVFLFFISLPFLVIWAFIKNRKALPNLKSLDEYKKKLLLKKLLQYNNDNITYLNSTYSVNGCGTRFFKLGSFRLEDEVEEINIFAKSQSAFYMPLPFILGYIVCRGKKDIISTISKEDFKLLKKEIEEEII